MKPEADNKNRKGLPQNIPPTNDRRGICVSVPNDVEYIALFMGALYDLSKQSRYDRDPLHRAKTLAGIWGAIYQETAEGVRLGTECNDLGIGEEGCIQYMPNHPMFQYAPNDPFQSPNFKPDGYALPPFYTNALISLPGVLPTDAMVNFLSIPVTMTLPEIIEIGYPRIRIPVEGAGEVEIELVRIPQGGIALVNSDADFGTMKVVDLNSVSIVGLPSVEDILDVVLEDKVNETEILEFDFAEPGAHFIDIVFLPNIGSSVLLGFGGGLRRVSYCAAAEPGDIPVPEIRIVNCNLEWRPNNLTAWINLGNVCGEDGANGSDGSSGAAGADAQWPVGVFVPYGGNAAPAGWMICDGAAISRSTYAELFAVIGTNFGAGNGSTTFNIPDMRQRYARGIGSSSDPDTTIATMGQKFGQDGEAIALENLPPHDHVIRRRLNSSAGTSAQLMAGSGTGTQDDSATLGMTGATVNPPEPLDTRPRTLAANYIICTESVHSNLDVQFQVVGCSLQWRKSSGDSWTTLVDLTDCTEPGLTPEFRMTAITATRQAIEYKYTNQLDLPGAWTTIGYVDDGEPGIAGEPENQVWRLISESATRRVLQWRFESDPDIPASYRTVGAWDIPTNEACDCPSIPAPGEVQENPDRCKIAWGLANRISTELIGMVVEFDNDFAWPLDLIEAPFVALAMIESRGIFLSRLGTVADYLMANWNSIPDSTDAGLYIGELGDIDNIREFAEMIYTFYDPNYGLNDSYTAIIAATTIAGNIGNRALLGMAGWLTAPNIEHWQDAILNAAINDAPQDCDDFGVPSAVTGAIFNFEFPDGEIFEDDTTYLTTIKLSLASGTLSEETRVYYTAQDMTAVNGADYFLPAGFVTFPMGAANGLERNLAFSIIDNPNVDGNRQLRVKLTEVIGTGIIGNQPNHLVTIKDNEDFYLILERGSNFVKTGDWTWEATSIAFGGNQEVIISSMNLDPNRCFKLLSVTYGGLSPSGKAWQPCSFGGQQNGTPLSNVEIWRLVYFNSGMTPFTVTVTIEPA